MNSQVYVISDTHLGHKNIIRYEAEKRPFATIEEHDEAIVQNWNAVVRKQDTVIHLGDVLFGADSFKYLTRLNGIKRLVLGNHDHYPINRYLEHFVKVYGAMEYKNCILTHIPVHTSQLEGRWRYNIHGHCHSDVVLDHDGFESIWHRCVSVEHTGLKPVLLSSLLV